MIAPSLSASKMAALGFKPGSKVLALSFHSFLPKREKKNVFPFRTLVFKNFVRILW